MRVTGDAFSVGVCAVRIKRPLGVLGVCPPVGVSGLHFLLPRARESGCRADAPAWAIDFQLVFH